MRKQLMSRKEAAEYLGIKYQSLGNLAYTKQSPPFYRLGSGKCVRYDVAELNEWLIKRN